MTLRELQDEARKMGMRVTKQDGEYRVAPKRDTAKRGFALNGISAKLEIEDYAYYTDDIKDAYQTMVAEATWWTS